MSAGHLLRATPAPTRHEQRLARRLLARGDDGLAEALLRLRGLRAGGRYEIARLYAVGAEGAVYDVSDLADPSAPLVAKVALLPVHRPFDLEPDDIRRRRYALRVESQYLVGNTSPFMPRGIGLHEITNPLLDVARGDAFGEPEPVLVMEKLPGHDLDRWLARMHRSGMDRHSMRRTLDRIAVVLLQALTDLRRRGLHYADLRPGNMRMMGRPERRVRMLDAGSLVSVHDHSGRFPHVPAYLPAETFLASRRGERIVPTDAIQAVMAGRTLFECATGRVPRPGEPVDVSHLGDSNVSGPVADVIARLCEGEYEDVRLALEHLYAAATRRVARGNDPASAATVTATQRPEPAHADAPSAPAPAEVPQPGTDSAGDEDVLPPSRPRPSLLRRVFGRLLGR